MQGVIKLLSTGGKKIISELQTIEKLFTSIFKKQQAINKTALKFNKVRAATRRVKGTGLNLSTNENRTVSDKASAQTKRYTAALNKANKELNEYVRNLATSEGAQRLFTGSNKKVTTQVSALKDRLNSLSRSNKEYTSTLQGVLRGEQALYNQQRNRSVDELKQLTQPRLTKAGTVDKRYGAGVSDLVKETIDDLPNVANSIKGLEDYSNRLEFLKNRVDISSQSFKDLQAQIDLVGRKLGKTKIDDVAKGPATKLDSLDAFRQKERFASDLNKAEDKRLKLLSQINDSSLSEITKQKLKNQLSQTDIDLQQKELQLAKDNNREVERELSSLNKKQRQQRADEYNLQRNKRLRNERVGRIGQSALIGGGFPFLFGGGPLQAAAGALGGGIGEAVSPRGGFAGSIAATALISQLDAFAQKARELGDALKRPSDALSALAEMGLVVDDVFQKEIETLVAVGREAEAMTMVNKELARTIGTDGIERLTELDTAWDSMGDELGKLKLQIMSDLIPAAIAVIKLVEKFVDTVGAQRLRSKAQELNPEAYAQAEKTASKAAIAANPSKGIIDSLFNMFGVTATDVTKGPAAEAYYKSLTEESKKIIQKEMPGFLGIESSVDTKNNGKIGAGNTTGITLGDKNRALEEQIDLLNRSFEIGSKAAGQEQEAAELLLEQNKIYKQNLTLNETDILQKIQQRDRLQENLEMWEQIKNVIATGLTSAIQGLIEGTKTLGESLAGIAKQIANLILQKAILSAIDKGFSFGSGGVTKGSVSDLPKVATAAQGAYFTNGIKPFSTGGMATRPTLGLIGEAGESEYIIPASKMAASMQRYSAGARGEAVIPGTGSSYAGSGGSSTTVNYSGPILNFNSEEFVPKSAVGQIIASAAKQGASMGEARTIKTMQNNRSTRSRLGM